MHFSRKVGDHNACLPVLIQSESVSCFVVSDSVTPWTVVQQAPVSMGFSKQKYPSGLPFPSPGDLPDPGIEPGAPALQEDSLLSEPPGWDTNGITAVRALETSWAAGSRGYSYSHGTYAHAQRWQRRRWCQGMSRQGPACLPSQRTVWGKPLHPDCGVILSLITGSVDHHLLLVFSLQLLVPFPGCSRWESNSFLSLLCVTALWPVPLTWVPVAFRRSLKLAGLSSAWQEAGQTELMGCGSMTWYSYHSDIFTLQIRPNASYSPPGKKQIGWRRERLPTSVFWPGEFHGWSPWDGKESDATERLSFSLEQ